MKAKRGDTSGVLGEFLMDQALADKMLADALGQLGPCRSGWGDEEGDDQWAPVQAALELGADWRKRAKEIQEAALRHARMPELRSLEGLGFNFEKSDARALGDAAARLGHAPWLAVALRGLADRGETLGEQAARDSLMGAAARGETAVLAAFEERAPLDEESLRQIAAECARRGRWKMCAQLLKRATAPDPSAPALGVELQAERFRRGEGLASWPGVWAFCVSIAAGLASEKGAKALLRAWRETPQAPWRSDSPADAQLWMGAQDPLRAALCSRNRRSGERIAKMLLDAGLEWRHSETLPRALADNAIGQAEAARKLGASLDDCEGACGLAAARSGSLRTLRWAAEQGLDLSKPSENTWDRGQSALSYLRNLQDDAYAWDPDANAELLGFAQASHDAMAVENTLRAASAQAAAASEGSPAQPAAPAAGRRRRL